MSEITGIVRDKHSFILGMEFAMRICRNEASNHKGDPFVYGHTDSRAARATEADLCASLIRIVQVEIGSGRSPLPEFTPDEIDEVERIS